MVETDTAGGVTVTMRHLTLILTAGGIVASILATIVGGVMLYDKLSNTVIGQKDDLGRVWSQIDERKKSIEVLALQVAAARDLNETKYQHLADTALSQADRLDAVSNNVRILETNMNAISSNLTASIREEAVATNKILEKVNDLGTAFAELRGELNHTRDPSQSPK